LILVLGVMSDFHLKILRDAIERRGWAIEELPGDDYAVSATWRITRGESVRLHIDFDGLDDMQTLPIQISYGCARVGARSTSTASVATRPTLGASGRRR
jgi:hypothetical protein